MDDELKRRIRKHILELKKWGMQREATVALGEIGEPAVSALIEALKDDMEVREQAAKALGEIARMNPGKSEVMNSVPALIEALKDDSSWIRATAANALGGIAYANQANTELVEAIPALIESLKDEKRWVQMGAARALGNIGEPALGQINKAYLEGRISYEVADVFYLALYRKLSKEGFDKGTVAPPKKKPDDLKRTNFRKPPVVPKPGLRRCIAGG